MTKPKDELAALKAELKAFGRITGSLPPSRFNDKFILEGHTPVECRDLILWATWMEDTRKERIVQQDQIGDYWVSTVFLGLDHSFGRGLPILFETMTFIGKPGRGKGAPKTESDGYDRYCTWDEALAGHLAICERLRNFG